METCYVSPYICGTKANNMRTTKEIIVAINNVRSKQRRDFKSTEDYLNYGKEIAEIKAKLFAELEAASRIEYPESYK